MTAKGGRRVLDAAMAESRATHPSDELVRAHPLAEKQTHPLASLPRARVTLDGDAGRVVGLDVEFERLDVVLVYPERRPEADHRLRLPEVPEYHVVIVGRAHPGEGGDVFTFATRDALDD